MIRALSMPTAFAAALAFPAMAQDTNPESDQNGSAGGTTAVQPSASALSLTDDEGRMWIDKPDAKELGEVLEFLRDAENKVIGMHADIGGFMGLGETRVNLTAAQFKLQGNRVVFELTAEQTNTLPNVQN